MKSIYRILLLSVLVILCNLGPLAAQVSVKVTISNQEVIGTELFFDIYLHTTPDNTGGDLYLSDSDFVIDFNSSAFTNPTLTKVEDPSLTIIQYGYVTLLPTIVTGTILDDVFRSGIYNSTSPTVAVSGTEVIINLQGSNPTSVAQLQQNVALIDDQTYTHRLGRFKITGITNPSADLNLGWDVDNLVPTAVFSYDPVSLIATNTILCFQVDSMMVTPPDPDTLSACAQITNQMVSNDSLYFDVYFNTENTGDLLYLADANLALEVDPTAFNNPVFSKIPDPAPTPFEYGYVSFLPTTVTGTVLDDLFRFNVYNDINTQISGGNQFLDISYTGAAPANQIDLESDVPLIDDQATTHRLGRFAVTGLIDPTMDPNLAWSTIVPSNTEIFTYDPTTFVMDPVNLCQQIDPLVIDVDPPGPEPDTVKACLRVANQILVNDSLYFDVFMNTAPDNTGGELYLADAALSLSFNQSAFTNPVLQKVEDPSLTALQYGYVSLLPSVVTGTVLDDLFRFQIYDNTNLNIAADNEHFLISYTAPPASNNSDLLNQIALIDDQELTHRLGRFLVTGATDPLTDFQLDWEDTGSFQSAMLHYDSLSLVTTPVELCFSVDTLQIITVEPPVLDTVKACLTLTNQELTNDSLYFDIFVNTSVDNTAGDLFMGDAGLSISFNTAAFTNPQISKVEDPSLSNPQFGYVSLLPSIVTNTVLDDLFREVVFNTTVVSLSGDNAHFLIDYPGAMPADNAALLNDVPLVDGQEDTHRLGRFLITGATDTNADFQLDWQETGSFTNTMTTYDSTSLDLLPVQLCFNVDTLVIDDPNPMDMDTVSACVHLTNQELIGDELFFDIYLNTSPDNTAGNLYLADSDFIISYNPAAFVNPGIEKVEDPSLTTLQYGFVSLLPTLVTGTIADDIFRLNVYNSTLVSPSPISDDMLIQYNGSGPNNPTQFDQFIPNIDDQVLTHRLGRFKMTGASDPDMAFDLDWNTTGVLVTDVFSYNDMTYQASRIDLCTVLDTLEIEVVDPDTSQVKACVTLTNQVVKTDTLEFDLFLNTSPDNTDGDLFLADSDFVINYNPIAFSQLIFEKVEDPDLTPLQYGFVSLLPTTITGTIVDDVFRTSVFNNTTTFILGATGDLGISFSSQGPTNALELEQNIARVDDQENVHRFGRFRVIGVIDPALFPPDLTFVESGVFNTEIFSYGEESLQAKLVDLCYNVDTLEIEVDPMGPTAAVKACLTITNQEISNDSLYFDIFMNTSDDNLGGDLYLADSDLIIDFNEDGFTNPQVGKVEDPSLTILQYGYVSLLPTLVTGTILDDVFRQQVFSNTSTGFDLGAENLVIGYFGTSPNNQTVLQQSIPLIDDQEYTHRFGRFFISGITDTTEVLNLTWANGSVFDTDMFTYFPGDLQAYPVEECFNVDTLEQNLPDPPAPPPVGVCLTVNNQVEDNGALVFDVYLRTSDDNIGGDLFLASSQFVLDYDASAFSNPALFKVEDPTLTNNQYGFVTLLPTIVTGTVFDDIFRESVFDNTSTSVNLTQNSIIIDYLETDPTNTTELELEVARIDNQTNVHRLGRFRMTGFLSPGLDPDLSWNNVGPSADSTEVFSYNPESFEALKADLCLEIDPYVPIDTMPEVIPVEACAVITNQILDTSKTELSFDIFLNTTPDNPGGDLYLADSDFIISFNSSAFTNPSFSKVEDPSLSPIQYGYVTLLPTVVTGTILDDVFRSSIYNSTSTAVSFTGDDLVISYFGPNPGDITALENSVPRIDGDQLTHRFGRFKVSGLDDPTADVNLQWNTNGVIETDIYSYNPDDLNAYQIDLCTEVEPFVDTSNTDPTGSLEFEFITFEGWNVDLSYNQLEFTVRNEFDIFFYNVTRSPDAVDFSTIGNIQALGVGADTAAYSFQDLDPMRGVNYYQIQAVTFTGEVIFSEIIEIRLDNGVIVEIYPQPVVDDLTINYFSESEQPLTIDLIDVLGRIVYTETFELGVGENEIVIDTRLLAAATYFIRMRESNSTETITEKVIIMNP